MSCCLAVFLGWNGMAAAQAPVARYSVGKEGTFKEVESVDTSLRDAKHGKDIEVVVCFPKLAQGPCPVIVFSHGAGGSGRMVTALPKYWVSHGYVVLCPTHSDSISGGKGNGVRGIVASLNDPEIWKGRAADVSFLLDSLDDLGKKIPGLSGKMDPKRVGVGGHSLGAYTSQLIGGATIDLPGEKTRSFADDRVRAILMLSGQGPGQQGLTEHSWDGFTRPCLSITGTADRGMGGKGYEWKGEPFRHAPAGDKYHIVIDGAHHGSFTGRERGGRMMQGRMGRRLGGNQDPGGDQKAIFGYVEVCTLAFWDAYLKDEPDAKAYLGSDALGDESKGAVHLKRK